MNRQFSYSMQNILNLRDVMKQSREMELAEAHLALRNERNNLRRVLAEMRKAMLFDEAKMRDADASYFLQRERYLRKIRQARDAAENAVRMASIQVEKCRLNLIEAHTELRKMEKNRERHAERWRVDANLVEHKFNDEVANTISHAKARSGLE